MIAQSMRLNRDTDKQVMRLAVPGLLENLATQCISLVDTAMVGSLGPLATAAVGMNAPVTWLLNGLIQALGVGGVALVARMVGAGEEKEANHVVRQVTLMTVLLSIAIMVLMLVGAPLVPLVMRADAALHADGIAYMRWLSLGIVPYYVGLTLSAMMRGAGDAKTPMYASILANVMNVALNFLLIYPTRVLTMFGVSFTMWGAGQGVAGAASASSLAMASSGIFLIVHMIRKKGGLRLQLRGNLHFDKDVVKRVLRVSYPTALERASINLGQIVFASMVSSIGAIELAAHTQAITVEGFGYMPAFGFGAAATALAGQSLGAGDPAGAKKRSQRAITLCVLLLTLSGALMFVFAPFLISLLTPDADARLVGAMLIRICAFEQPFNAITIVTSGALRGAGDTRMPFVYSLATMWGVRIVLAYLFNSVFGWGVAGLWWAMVADLGVRSILMYSRFRQGKWLLARV